jgi:CheY-like chemotaxis protein
MKSMLMINSSESIARLFGEIFEKRGWNVAICGPLDSATERLAGNEPYDVILLSHRVPGTTGVQLIRLIRLLEHRRMAAVIMVTASPEVTDEALAAGADEVLLRPVNPNALIWIVDKLVT